MKTFKTLLLILIALNFSVGYAQNDKDVTIKTVKLSDKIYMLIGYGGNIGISIGEDGVFMIDDQFAQLSTKILLKR